MYRYTKDIIVPYKEDIEYKLDGNGMIGIGPCVREHPGCFVFCLLVEKGSCIVWR